MSLPLTSRRKANALANGIFLVGLITLFYTDFWWPGILLALWASLALRQHLRGRKYDMVITTLIIGGFFLVTLFRSKWDILLPILFFVGGIYIIFREYFVDKPREGEEKIEEMAQEIENNIHPE